jgi:Raf kinase inhibitor-like YbhB/YbcL family protein
MTIELTSPAFEDGGTIPEKHTRLGGNVSPALAWSGVPADAAELVLTLQDPDAPSGTFTHWVLAGIDPDLDGLDEGDVPDGTVEGGNDFGEEGYDGPQPPVGDPPHRYVFTLLALAEESGLGPGAASDDVDAAVESFGLDRGRLTGRYGR